MCDWLRDNGCVVCECVLWRAGGLLTGHNAIMCLKINMNIQSSMSVPTTRKYHLHLSLAHVFDHM